MSNWKLPLKKKLQILNEIEKDPDFANLEYEKCKRFPYYWMVNWAYTLDEHAPDGSDGIMNFPDLPYIEEFVYVWQNEPKVIVPKSRQMMMSWICVGLYLHWVMFYPGKRVAFQSKKEEDADALVKRAKFIYDHQPRFLKRNPVNPTQQGRDIYRQLNFPGKNRRVPDHNSYIEAVAQGPDQTRGKTYSGFFSDEAAFQDKFEEAYVSLIPTIDKGAKLTCISSAAAESFFKKLVFDELV